MRIAAIADVHGNLPALDAVLASIAGDDVDLVVNLGDLLSGGVQPRETADRLMALGLPTVKGNHERQVLTFAPASMMTSDRLAHDTITDAHRPWLDALPMTLEILPGVLAFHATPTDDLVYLLETVDPDGVLRPATEEEVLDRLGDVDAWSLMLGGHTHVQREMLLPGGTLVVNPGSVGWPAFEDSEPHPHRVEAGTPHARYCVVDDVTGSWEVDFRAVTYDHEAAASIADANGRPDIAHALRTGRM